MQELEPCRRCNGNNIHISEGGIAGWEFCNISCNDCGYDVGDIDGESYKTRQEAIDAWNTQYDE